MSGLVGYDSSDEDVKAPSEPSVVEEKFPCNLRSDPANDIDLSPQPRLVVRSSVVGMIRVRG